MRQKCGFAVPVVVSILALIVAAWSLYYAGRSADAAEDARDAVRLEQRAWLGLQGDYLGRPPRNRWIVGRQRAYAG